MSADTSYAERAKKLLPPNPKAFIVDDSVPTRRIFRTILEELGFTVSEAGKYDPYSQIITAT